MHNHPHRLLSRYRIATAACAREGRLLSREEPPGKGALRSRLAGWGYDEKHLEEWVCREPAALFPGHRPHVLVAEKYAQPLPCKVDLLLIDAEHCFHVVELKVTSVLRNGGEAPSKIRRQMQRYVNTLTRYLPPFPQSMVNAYTQFSASFYGAPRCLVDALREPFGSGFCDVEIKAPRIHQVYVAEEYDHYAVDYFRSLTKTEVDSSRLVYYRFYPVYPEGPYIEFWEIPLGLPCAAPSGPLPAP
jgi:hypothetical protein